MKDNLSIALAGIVLLSILVAQSLSIKQLQKETTDLANITKVLNRDLRYWVPSPKCNDCHTTRKVKR